MESIIAVGDVHGCYHTLLALMAQLPKGQKVVFVGDLIDRGSGSKQVVDYVMKNGHDCVQGNHEEMMIMSKKGVKGNVHEYCQWLINGGAAALASYAEADGRFDQETFDKHVAWMESLPITIEYPDVVNEKGERLLISHSSAGGVYDWTEEKKEMMMKQYRKYIMWGRPQHLMPLKGIYSVFGHTPIENGPRIKSFYANIDTGAVFKGAKDAGFLTALEFPSMKVYKQENIDRPSFYHR